MRRPQDFEFNIGFDEDEEEYYAVFAPTEEGDDDEVWIELKVIVPPGFWKREDEGTYEFLMRPHEAIETLRRNGFVHNLDLV